MNTYKINIDTKHTIWHRTHIEIDAESVEEATEKAKKIFDEKTESDLEGTWGDTDTWGDTMLDTMEPMTTKDNGGASTRELYVLGDYVKDNTTE
jgi:hypothetical protein